MPPEQIDGAQITPLSDLYALGCVLHELLAGEPVFSGDNDYQLMHQHMDVPPVPSCLVLALFVLQHLDAQAGAVLVELVESVVENLACGRRGLHGIHYAGRRCNRLAAWQRESCPFRFPR